MTTTLSFHKESIHQASSASETLNRQAAERTDASSPKHAREQRPITLTTTIFAV